MNKLARPARAGQAPRPVRGMRTGTGIFLLAAGAILLFALRSGSPHWVNLHIVGAILILAGVLGLLLPRLVRAPRDLLHRWVVPAGSPGRRRARNLGSSASPVLAREPGPEDPTLADQVLQFEHDLPV